MYHCTADKAEIFTKWSLAENNTLEQGIDATLKFLYKRAALLDVPS